MYQCLSKNSIKITNFTETAEKLKYGKRNSVQQQQQLSGFSYIAISEFGNKFLVDRLFPTTTTLGIIWRASQFFTLQCLNVFVDVWIKRKNEKNARIPMRIFRTFFSFNKKFEYLLKL
jgi:hypothetical protein